MSYYLSLYWRLVGARWRGQMQYKLSFLLLSVGSALAILVDFLAILVFFEHVPLFLGWSLLEVALLYGVGATAFALTDTVAAGFDAFHRNVVQGTLDRALVRPLPAFFQTFASDLAVRKAAKVLQSFAILAAAAAGLGTVWSWDKLRVLFVAIVSGTLIFFSFVVLGAASSFWTIQANEAVNVFTHGGAFVSGYPLEIFQGWLRRFVTLVVPIAFINYYPTLYLLDRPDPLGLPGWTRLASPLAAAAFCGLAYLVWRAGVRRYQSTGS